MPLKPSDVPSVQPSSKVLWTSILYDLSSLMRLTSYQGNSFITVYLLHFSPNSLWVLPLGFLHLQAVTALLVMGPLPLPFARIPTLSVATNPPSRKTHAGVIATLPVIMVGPTPNAAMLRMVALQLHPTAAGLGPLLLARPRVKAVRTKSIGLVCSSIIPLVIAVS